MASTLAAQCSASTRTTYIEAGPLMCPNKGNPHSLRRDNNSQNEALLIGMLRSDMMSFEGNGNGKWALLSAHLPGRPRQLIGILLVDTRRDELHVKLAGQRWSVLADGDEGDIWRELAGELEQQGREIGAVRLLEWLNETASHALQISRPQEIQIHDPNTALEDLYRRHVLITERRQQDNAHDTESKPAVISVDQSKRTAGLPKWRRWFLPQLHWAQIALAASLVLAAAFVGRKTNLQPKSSANDARINAQFASRVH